MTGWHSLRRALPWLAVPAWWIVACGGTVRDGGLTNGAGATQGGASNRGGTVSTQPPVGRPVTGGSSPSEMGGGGEPGIMLVPGTSDRSTTIKCGADLCTSVKTLAPNLYVDPCCSGDTCGVSTQFFASLGASFKNTCQAVGQKGARDVGCPTSPPQQLMAQGNAVSLPGFVGCCRADTGTCGVVVDNIAVAGIPLPFASPMLGCVDSAPFFGSKPGALCGAAGAGAGGADWSGAGAPSSAGTPALAGAPSGGVGGAE